VKFSILTLFPEFFQTPLSTSLIGKAKENGIFSVELIQIRDFGIGKYKAVDDRPFGGGAGMLIMAEVLESALKTVFPDDKDLTQLEKSVFDFKNNQTLNNENPFVVMLSPQGIVWNASKARAFSKFSHLVLICGHYEGVDQRFIDHYVNEEVSIGDYVLTGGEIPAMVIADSVTRIIKGVLEKVEATQNESYEKDLFFGDRRNGDSVLYVASSGAAHRPIAHCDNDTELLHTDGYLLPGRVSANVGIRDR
jgi:tRNA (guanine37-N1)-methyltransferase